MFNLVPSLATLFFRSGGIRGGALPAMEASPTPLGQWSDPERANRIARPVGPRPSQGPAPAAIRVKGHSRARAADTTRPAAAARVPDGGAETMASACIVVGRQADGFMRHVDLLAERMGKVVVVGDIAGATAVRADAGARASRLILVDIDALDPCERVVDDLLAFRRHLPDMPVLIGSRKFRRNDFSMERAVIADASVRLPASPVLVERAIWHAVENRVRAGA